jgi:hypothetical protein
MRSGKGIGSCAASPTRRKAAPQERSAANRRGEGDAQRRLARWAGSEGECVAGLKTLVNFSSQTIFSCSIRIGHLEIVSFPWTLARSSRPCHAHANSIACFSKKKSIACRVNKCDDFFPKFAGGRLKNGDFTVYNFNISNNYKKKR